MDTVLATKSFQARSGKVTLDIRLDLIPSGAFAYGNRHALLMQINQEEPIFFDVRYDARFTTPESFQDHAYEVVRGYLRQDFEITPA